MRTKIRGQSLYKTTAMNVDDWNDIIDLDNLQDEGDLEMGVLKTKKAFIDPSTLPYSPYAFPNHLKCEIQYVA